MSLEVELIRGKIRERFYAEDVIKGKKAKLKNEGYSGYTERIIHNMRTEAVKEVTHIDIHVRDDLHYIIRYGLDGEDYYPMSAIAEILV